MKKLCIILAAAFLLSAVGPCRAADVGASSSDDGTAYIVKLKQPAKDSVSLMAETGLTEISAEAGLYRAESISEVEALGSRVEYCEKDCVAKLSDLPDDTYAEKQWSLDYLGVDTAWDDGYTGEGVKIAVIDSGVNSMHEDFEGTDFAAGFNVINGSHDVTDENGHGTFVCGLLAAARNNEKGIAGLCSKVTIVPIKCFADSSETNASYIITAIYEAVDIYGCDVINLSLGMEDNLVSMKEAVEYATAHGAIVVSAVGNDGTSKMNYPAAYDCVIGVGAVGQNGYISAFSEKNESVFVVAPGEHIVSLTNTSASAYLDGSGTSFSTPFVSAAAVFLKQYSAGATTEDFKQLLESSSVDEGAAGYDTSYGYGVLNIADFVAAMQDYELRDIGDIFPDVKDHWASSSIDYCYRSGLFTGTTDSSFEPETIMNRAMFVTVLSRMSGEDVSGFPNVFTDVPDGEWYCQPCGWGSANGIVSGRGGGIFDPLGAVTREQMAVFLYRYAILYGLTDGSYEAGALSAFSDADGISDWAADAMAWAVYNGLITGRSATTLCPQESAKRCEVATIVARFAALYADD